MAKERCMTHYQAERRAAAREPVDPDERDYGSYRATIGGRPFSLSDALRLHFADGTTRSVSLMQLTDMIASAEGWKTVREFHEANPS